MSDCAHNISYVQGINMIFALNYLKIRELVPPKLSCHLRISKSLIALLFRCLINVSSRTRLRVGFRCFEGHFRTRWCLRHVFCGVMHHCVVRRSGSVPTEIAEPTREAQSSRHVFIETLQSKDFSEILLICVNFGIHSLTGIIKFSEAKISILSL